MDDRVKDLMDAIRAEAAICRVTVKKLAMSAGVSYPAMRRYLNGERDMNLSQLHRVADALDTTVGELQRLADARNSGDPPAKVAEPPDAPLDMLADHRVRQIIEPERVKMTHVTEKQRRRSS